MADDLRALIFEIASEGDHPALGSGWVGLVASARGLRQLGLPAPSYKAALRGIQKHYPDAELVPDDRFLLECARQVTEYMAGTRRDFTVELDLRGHTAFELVVWAAAARIPYGETRTYGWIAVRVGGAGMAQAVGAALGDNPVPLIVPCHRVVGSDGSLHGFAGGLEMKSWLLALESGQGTFGLDWET